MSYTYVCIHHIWHIICSICQEIIEIHLHSWPLLVFALATGPQDTPLSSCTLFLQYYYDDVVRYMVGARLLRALKKIKIKQK